MTTQPASSQIGANLVNRQPPITTRRSDKYQKLLYRFYESVIILKVFLGQTRGPHIPAPRAKDGNQFAHRRFLRNLSYICDFDKGGETCTAIGLENHPDYYKFWVASNTIAVDKVVPFLEKVLELLHISCTKNMKSEKKELTELCIQFASRRISAEYKFLSRAVKQCAKYINKDTSEEDLDAFKWVRQFLCFSDPVALCQFAYEQRRSVHMYRMKSRSSDYAPLSSPDQTLYSTFRWIYHCIGRLAHHIRAPMELENDICILESLLSSYKVCPVPTPQCVQKPEPDALTTLDSILRRMLSSGDNKLEEYQEALNKQDRKYHIMNRIMAEYGDEKFVPKIHAEIQVLDYFYDQGLSYVNNDKYIGCSKPACFCCYLYIRYHPARNVLPESHQKIWPNWGPARLEGRVNDPKFVQQRNILHKMIGDIRQDALDQIRRNNNSQKWHPDSQTGITSSLDVNPHNLSLSEGSESSIDSDIFSDSSDFDTGFESEGPSDTPISYSQPDMQRHHGTSRYMPSDESDEDSDDGGVILSTS
ncbi:hypothetical protein F5884DRAFT_855622 [Xylogone sp. PMI_703]|nr:hypothetical protein F5884DRAFT_855622 [Xylogone sp. PMI_703]